MKNRIKKMVKYMVVLWVLGIVFSVTNHANSNVENDSCKPETATSELFIEISNSNIYGFKTYQEEISGFSFSYPETMTLLERYRQEFPYPEPDRILKRISLVEGQMFLDIDVWLKKEREFIDWVGVQDQIFNYTQTNVYDSLSIVTNKQKYAISIQQDSYPRMVLSMELGDYFVQFTQKFTKDANDFQKFVKIVSTIQLGDKFSLSEYFGEKFIAEINSYSVANQKAIELGKVIISADTCCGQSSPGNPFPCCDISSSKGNCTWYVYRQYGYVPFYGDAMTWAAQVVNHVGWYHSPSPAVPNTTRSIGEHRNPPYGHVAYISSGSSSGVNGSEQNWCETGCPVYFYGRPVNRFYGFIYHIKDLIP
jgi:hypothetical protein